MPGKPSCQLQCISFLPCFDTPVLASTPLSGRPPPTSPSLPPYRPPPPPAAPPCLVCTHGLMLACYLGEHAVDSRSADQRDACRILAPTPARHSAAEWQGSAAIILFSPSPSPSPAATSAATAAAAAAAGVTISSGILTAPCQ